MAAEPIVNPGLALTTALADIYTVPASKMAQVPGIHVLNTHTTEVTVTIEIIPSGGADNQVRYRCFASPVPAGFSDGPGYTFHLAAGTKIRAKASVDAVVSIFVSPIERDV